MMQDLWGMLHFIVCFNLKSTGEDNRKQKLESAKHLESIECTQLHAGKNINCKVVSIFIFFLPSQKSSWRPRMCWKPLEYTGDLPSA